MLQKLQVLNKTCINKLYSPLCSAIYRQNLNMIKLLVDAGGDINATDNYKNTSLHRAAQETDSENIFLFLLNSGAHINARNIEEDTPLLLVTKYCKNLNVLKMLVKAGADVNAKNRVGDTPLHMATDTKKFNFFEFLLDSGTDLHATNENQETLQHIAAKRNNTQIMKRLLDSGVDVNAKDKFGSTPIHAAVNLLDIGFLKILMEAGARMNELNNIGETALTVLDESFEREGRNFFFTIVEDEKVKKTFRFVVKYTNINLKNTNGINIVTIVLKNQKEINYKIIIKHVAKWKSSDIHVDRSLLSLISHEINFQYYFLHCMKELKEAKNIKLHKSWVTFFNLAVDGKSKFVKYAGNEDLLNDFEETDVEEIFPIYEELMKSNMNKGIHNRKLFDGAVNIMNYCIPVLNPMHLIIRDVLDILNEKDWKNLCEKKRFRE